MEDTVLFLIHLIANTMKTRQASFSLYIIKENLSLRKERKVRQLGIGIISFVGLDLADKFICLLILVYAVLNLIMVMTLVKAFIETNPISLVILILISNH